MGGWSELEKIFRVLTLRQEGLTRQGGEKESIEDQIRRGIVGRGTVLRQRLLTLIPRAATL